jgi:hypothetical protein
MPINKFNSDKLLDMPKRIDGDLFAIERAWQYLTYWQKKKMVLRFRMEVVKVASRKKLDQLRAVIVSACSRALVILHGDRADRPTWEQLFAMSTEQERIEMILLLMRTIERRERRAVIVSAVYRAGLYIAGVCDLLSVSGIHFVFALLFLLIFSVR